MYNSYTTTCSNRGQEDSMVRGGKKGAQNMEEASQKETQVSGKEDSRGTDHPISNEAGCTGAIELRTKSKIVDGAEEGEEDLIDGIHQMYFSEYASPLGTLKL